jgi:hypothetical protein
MSSTSKEKWNKEIIRVNRNALPDQNVDNPWTTKRDTILHIQCMAAYIIYSQRYNVVYK